MSPIVTAAMAALAMVYPCAALARGRRPPAAQIACFVFGWIALAVALLSPLHDLTEENLSAHMLQHEMLMMIAAPLLVFGRAHFTSLALLPIRWRRLAGRWLRCRAPSTPVTWTLHTAALWIWHIPALYDAAVSQPLIHHAQHLSFFGSAILFWWSILDRRTGYGVAGLYVFLTSLHSGLLGVLLFLSPRLWYASYAQRPNAIADQQLAGILMWVPGGIVFAVTTVLLIWRWMTEMEKRAAARDRIAVRRARISRTVSLFAVLAFGCALLPACNDGKATAVALTGGDPERGKNAIRKYGCWTCHTIPGIQGANSVVGPPLEKIASRSYVAGQANSVAHMIEWIREPQKVRKLSPMPNMGVTESEARDIAAYLYTLR